ncbi:MAG: acyl-CoA synthetase (AMP-forming)/AMP-acid ligase [Deltaproteobacteria bacterium]|jgi:acyl-CoA synthetase (AMP-forming)/AMP-acid ligase II|nr:acyl-CoA synthetase (AMP-forming)/AMP-acid ligase [Deltaproteobacteria bacterium]
MIVGDMLTRNANKFPRKSAIVSEGTRLDYRTLNERVNRLSNSLLEKGLRKGDHIGVLVHNCHQFIELYFAAAKTGGVFCPYNNHLKGAELREVINYSEPRFFVLDQDYANLVEAIRGEVSCVEQYISLQSTSASFMVDYEELISRGKDTEPPARIVDEDVISIVFTAGTTGKPKGAMRTHRHLVTNAVAGVIELRAEYDEKVLISFPMYHVACEDNIVRHTYMPNTFVIKREGAFNPDEILEIIEKERITRCQLVPTMLHALLQSPNIDRYALNSLRLIVYAGAPMPVELLKRAMERFKCGFAQLYGQTESGPMTTILKPEDHPLEGSPEQLARLASAGKPVVCYEIRIVDDEGRDVGVGEVGEIVGRSEAMMKGYWKLPKETEEKLKNGWLHTGDLGRVDSDGYIYVVERKNDMIISGGVNIYPREIEEVLYQHPAVLEASVIGIPDEYWGESAKAVIVLKQGAQASQEEIIRFCGERLAGFKKPKSVEFWQELPKSPQGKILKKSIREFYAKK